MVLHATYKSNFTYYIRWYILFMLPQPKMPGLFLIVMGQFFRSVAMIEAASNFSHQIATEKRSTHTLVTSGVYALVRHPSYFGFFWWSVGTQVFLANPLSTVVFVAVLWRFFSQRIQYFPFCFVRFND